MRISDLFREESVIYIDRLIDTERELKISCDARHTDSDTLLFYPKPIGKEVYTLPSFKTAPYAIVCDWQGFNTKTDIPLIKVKSARRALADAYSNYYRLDYERLRVIGVTGTNGKTSTATMLEKILIKSGKGVGYIGTGSIRINGKSITEDTYSMTTPDPSVLYSALAKMSNEGCEFAVMEVSSHALSLSRCAPIRFTLGIFTNLSSDHMDFHKNKEEYFKAKLSLFESCKIGVFNIDDEYAKRAYESCKCEKYSIGVIRSADATVTALTEMGLSSTEFFYKENSMIFKLSLKLGGAYNVYNSLCAAKAAIALGIRPCIVKEALCRIEKIDGRLEVISQEPFVIIDYAHTAEALENLLKLINSTKNNGQKLTLVFGCGGDRDKSKRALMGAIAEKYADKIVLTEDNSRSEDFQSIKQNILSGIKDSTSVTVIEKRKDAIEYAISTAASSDIVAIVGKGHERYIIDNDGTHFFDERSIVLNVLCQRRRI